MRALVYRLGHGIALEDVPAPSDSGQVLVDVLLAGICGTDLQAVQKGFPPLPSPFVLGHEFVGVRQDTGEVVVANTMVTCGKCPSCLAGDSRHCDSRQIIGFDLPGIFAERVSVPPKNLLPVGPAASVVQAALVEPLATALHAWRLASPAPGANVGIIGAGGIGMPLLHVANVCGAGTVDVSDIDPDRLALVLRMGATSASAGLGSGYDAVFDLVGSRETRAAAVSALRWGGTCVMLGLHELDIALGVDFIVEEKIVKGTFAFTDGEFREAVGLAAALDTSWTSVVSLEDGVEILNGRRPLPPGTAKVMVYPGVTRSPLLAD